MGEAKFTPGPWRFVPGMLAGGFEYIVGNAGCELNISAESAVTVEQTDANAHLIAAAPELYTELAKLFNRWNNTREGSPHRVIDDDDAAAIRALLAKARGEQP